MAIDRASKLLHAELHKKRTAATAAEFLRNLIERVPFRIHTVLTDDCLQFTSRGSESKTSVFDCICQPKNILHRLKKPNYPWTEEQVGRMNRIIEETAAKRHHYGSHPQIQKHLSNFLDVYNFSRRLKALKGKTPFKEIMQLWTNEPEFFTRKPENASMRSKKLSFHFVLIGKSSGIPGPLTESFNA